MTMESVETFVDDDAGYVAWTTAHPDGYVVNTYRKPSPRYLMLHRVGCRTITGDPFAGVQWTKAYAKLCGSQDELERLAVDLGGEVSPCGICMR